MATIRCIVCNTEYLSDGRFACPKCKYPVRHLTYKMNSITPLINRRRETYRVDASKQYQNQVLLKFNELIQLSAKAPSMANMEGALPYLKTGELSNALREVWMQLVGENDNGSEPQSTRTDTRTQSKTAKKDKFENVKPGQSILMGKYNNKAIKWTILERKEHEVLAISDEVIDWMPFNKERQNLITWKDCTLRTWLNCDFYLTAFSEHEKKAIKYAVVKNLPIGERNMDTIDQLFLLSPGEVRSHSSIPSVNLDWHLRTIDLKGRNHFIADSLLLYGDCSESRGVRPAMCLDLNYLKFKK